MKWSDICVQGVDLSLTATGVVTIRESHVWVETIHTPPSWSEMRRRREIARRLHASLGDVRPAVVAVEEPLLARGTGDIPLRLAALHGVVRDHYWRPGIAVADVHASRLKAFATHPPESTTRLIIPVPAGKSAKVDVLTAAREILTPYFGFAADDNQADAMWLACMCLVHIGQPPFEPSLRQKTIVRDCIWPDVSLMNA